MASNDLDKLSPEGRTVQEAAPAAKGELVAIVLQEAPLEGELELEAEKEAISSRLETRPVSGATAVYDTEVNSVRHVDHDKKLAQQAIEEALKRPNESVSGEKVPREPEQQPEADLSAGPDNSAAVISKEIMETMVVAAASIEFTPTDGAQEKGTTASTGGDANESDNESDAAVEVPDASDGTVVEEITGSEGGLIGEAGALNQSQTSDRAEDSTATQSEKKRKSASVDEANKRKTTSIFEYTRKTLEKTPKSNARIFFFPDYITTNHYQEILYSGLSNGLEAVAGSIDDAMEFAGSGQAALFHLHWPEPVFVGVTESDGFRLRGEIFLAKLRRFQALGGSVLWTVHNKLPHDQQMLNLQIWFHRELAKVSDILHFHSEGAIKSAETIYKFPRGKCVVIPHPSYLGTFPVGISRVEARQRLGIALDEFVVGFVGQLRPYKGLDALLVAFQRLYSQHPEVRLLVAGKPVFPTKPGHWQNLSRVIAGLHVAEGFIRDEELRVYLGASDVLALPYTDILTSGSAMLAATYRTPVIIPDLLPLREIIDAGFAIPYDIDDSNGLFSSLKSAHSLSSAERDRLSRRADEFAVSRTPKRIGDMFNATVRAILRPPSKPAVIAGHDVTIYGVEMVVGVGSVGISIVNYRSAEEVEKLLKTLPRSVGKRSVGVFILDNSEDQFQVSLLRRILALQCDGQHTVLVQACENLGYAGGTNVLLELMQQAGYEFGFNVNPDICFAPRTLEELLSASEVYPDAILSPLILRENGNVSFAGGYISDLGTIEVSQHLDGESVDKVLRTPYPADVLNGCAFFFPLRLLDRLGHIPEEYFLYYEETDWFLGADRVGIGRIMVPASRVIHSKRSQGVTVPTLYYIYYLLRSAVLFNSRHGKSIEATEQRLRTTFVGPWHTKLVAENKTYVPIFDRAVAAALADGKAGIYGRIDLGARLDAIEMSSKRETVGWVDNMNGDHISGWLAERDIISDEPGEWQSSAVWLIADGIPVASATSNEDRTDVAEAGYGRAVGFLLKIPLFLQDGSQHLIEVRDGVRGTSIGMVEVDRERRVTVRLPPPAVVESLPNFRVRIDGIQGGSLIGWALDIANPGRAVILDVEVNGTVIPTVVADLFREDLRKAGMGEGRHALEIPLSKRFLLAGKVNIRFLRTGTKIELAKRELPYSLKDRGYNPDFTPENFLRWSFVEDQMPTGSYDISHRLRTFFQVTKAIYASRSAVAEPMVRMSVILPAFNRVNTVAASIQSVLNQTYLNWELLIIDDGSMDGTAETIEKLLAEMQDNRIQLIVHKQNKGVSAARNTGLKRATGEIIAYLDSDNTWYPEYLRVMNTCFGENPDHDTAYAGQEIWEYLPHSGESELRWVRASPFNRSKLEARNYIDLNVFAHRRSCLGDFGMFREDMRRLVDWELILRYTALKPPRFIPALLTRYYVNLADNQITKNEEFDFNLQKIRSQFRDQ